MSVDTMTSDEVKTNETEVEEKVVKSEAKTAVTNADDVEAKIKELESELQKKTELVRNLRKYEVDYKTRLESLENRLRDKAVDQALSQVISNSMARAPNTVAKLIDRSKIVVDGDNVDIKSIEEQINALKESDPILFKIETEETKTDVESSATESEEVVKAPKVKKANEGDPIGGYEKEIKAAKTAAEITAILKKYGKIT